MTRQIYASVVLGIMLALVAGPLNVASAQDASPAIDVDRDILYGTADGVPLLLDVYHPPNAATLSPAIVMVHGGGFVGGDKADPQFVQTAEILASQGFVVFSINYRLAPEYPFPAANLDTRRAVEFVRENADRFDVDPLNIGIAGASAGSTLGSWVAYRGSGDLETGSRVKAVVTWSGPFDFTIYLECGRANFDPEEHGEGFIPAGPNQLELAREASPTTYVDPTDPPILMTNSESELTPLCQPEAMQSALEDAGVPVTAMILPGSDHALNGNMREVLPATVEFFNEHLKEPAEQPVPGDDRPRRRIWIPIAVGVLVALILAAVAATRSRRSRGFSA